MKLRHSILVMTAALVQLAGTPSFANRCAESFGQTPRNPEVDKTVSAIAKSSPVADLSVIGVKVKASASNLETDFDNEKQVIVDFRSMAFLSETAQVSAANPATPAEVISLAARFQGKQFEPVLAFENVGVSNSRNTVDIAALQNNPEYGQWYDAIVAQVLITNLTTKVSKVVSLRSRADETYRTAIAIQEGKSVKLFDLEGRAIVIEEILKTHELDTSAIRVLRPGIVNPKDGRKVLPIDLGGEQGVVDFNVIGRSPSEKKFKREEETIAAAADTDLVPVEYMHHAQFAPTGHTTIRVGNSLIAFGMGGWKVHEGGMDSASAYLFNNPGVKRLADVQKPAGAQPFTLGVSFKRPKAEIMAFLEHAREQQRTGGGKKFNFFFNNCNKCPIQTWIGFGWDQFHDADELTLFSSILTFNELLHSSKLESPEYNVYPLNAKVEDDGSIRERITARLTGMNTRVGEILRLSYGLPKMALLEFRALLARTFDGAPARPPRQTQNAPPTEDAR